MNSTDFENSINRDNNVFFNDLQENNSFTQRMSYVSILNKAQEYLSLRENVTFLTMRNSSSTKENKRIIDIISNFIVNEKISYGLQYDDIDFPKTLILLFSRYLKTLFTRSKKEVERLYKLQGRTVSNQEEQKVFNEDCKNKYKELYYKEVPDILDDMYHKDLKNQTVILTNCLYRDMVEWSFLSVYLNPKVVEFLNLEEININSWNDIEIIYNGKREKLRETFLSPTQAVDIIRRMLQQSDTIIDDSNPVALGSLGNNTRITVLKTPILDNNIGISASIRIVSANSSSKNDLKKKLLKNTATADMLYFLENIINYGISVCIAGNTGSGKTTTANWLLSTIPNEKRIYTIEQGSREFNLIKYGELSTIDTEKVSDKTISNFFENYENIKGKECVVNRVVHTLTKSSNDEKANITQQKLLDLALRFNPDVICVGEMRSEEAFAAQEAARTGHTVITTIHSKNAVGTYMRMTTLAKRAYEFTDETLMRLMIEAFPIIVYQHQMEDTSRKITEIIEGEDFKDGKVIYRTLFKYVVDDNVVQNNKKTVIGHFERVNGISEALKNELMQNGMPKNMVNRFYEAEI